jgi:hypothetical protein
VQESSLCFGRESSVGDLLGPQSKVKAAPGQYDRAATRSGHQCSTPTIKRTLKHCDGVIDGVIQVCGGSVGVGRTGSVGSISVPRRSPGRTIKASFMVRINT